MLHFEVRFLKYSGLSPVQRLKGHGEGGGGGWSKCKIWSVICKKFCACTHFVQKREICGDYV